MNTILETPTLTWIAKTHFYVKPNADPEREAMLRAGKAWASKNIIFVRLRSDGSPFFLSCGLYDHQLPAKYTVAQLSAYIANKIEQVDSLAALFLDTQVLDPVYISSIEEWPSLVEDAIVSNGGYRCDPELDGIIGKTE